MTSFTNVTTNYPEGANTPIKRVKRAGPPSPNPPTAQQAANFVLGDEWLDTSAGDWWKLASNPSGGVIWIRIGGGAPSGEIETLTGDSGGAVGPDSAANVNILGAAGQIVVTGNSGTNTLTLSLAGGSTAIDTVGVDASTAPGTNPVVPTGTGEIIVTGGQVAPGTIGANVIQTDSLAANTYTIEIQQTSAVAAKDTTKNGVAHFNSSHFTNDQGFISLSGGGQAIDSFTTTTGGPIAPDGAGNVALTGASSTYTNGTVANTVRTEVQGTNHGVIIGQGTNTPAIATAAGATGSVFVGNTAADPAFSTTSASQFNSIQFHNTNAGTLSVYEDMTAFTPTIVGSTAAGVGTYTEQAAVYSRIGNMVFVIINLQWTAHTGTGDMRVSGFPYIFAQALSFYPMSCIMQNIALPANTKWVSADGVNNQIYAELTASLDAASTQTVQMSNAGSVHLMGVYCTNA